MFNPCKLVAQSIDVLSVQDVSLGFLLENLLAVQDIRGVSLSFLGQSQDSIFNLAFGDHLRNEINTLVAVDITSLGESRALNTR